MNWKKFLKPKTEAVIRPDIEFKLGTLIDAQGTRWENVKFRKIGKELYLEDGKVFNREDVIIIYTPKESS